MILVDSDVLIAHLRGIEAAQEWPVDQAVAWRAGEFRRKYRRPHNAIGIADYLIAATAELHECELATFNVRHLPMFAGLSAPFEL